METTQISFKQQMYNENIVDTYHGIIFHSIKRNEIMNVAYNGWN